MNHSVKRCRQALHQTHHHYYLNISVEAANLSDWRIEKIDSVARIESNRNFLPELECSSQHNSSPLLDPSLSVFLWFGLHDLCCWLQYVVIVSFFHDHRHFICCRLQYATYQISCSLNSIQLNQAWPGYTWQIKGQAKAHPAQWQLIMMSLTV